MWRRAQSTADNLPTNPSAGETARVGGKAASPYKRPSNPESQTVVVIKGFLGQGYKHPGHPAALSLDPCLRRLPAGDGKGGTGQGKGRQGPGGLQAGRPGFPNLILQRKKDARVQEMAEIPNPTTRNQREKGDKTQQGEPHQPRGSKTPQNAKKKSAKCLGERLREHVEPSGEVVQRGRVQHERKKVVEHKKNRKQTNKLIACHRSVLLNPVALKGKGRGDSTPPRGDPKTPNQTNPLTGTGT